MTKKEKRAWAVEVLFEKAEEERKRFLREYGWEYKCDYPDSCWSWSKMVKGGRITLSASEAFAMERDYIETARKAGD